VAARLSATQAIGANGQQAVAHEDVTCPAATWHQGRRTGPVLEPPDHGWRRFSATVCRFSATVLEAAL
jgi:hypothetical protein